MKIKINKKSKIIIAFGVLIFILIIGIDYFGNISKKSTPDLNGKHIVVYSCLREEETKAILELFKSKTNCSYEYIQLPTQEAISRIEDEKNSPKADIFLSGTKLSLQKLDKIDSIKRYVSKNSRGLPDEFKSSNGKWVAFEVHPFSIVINKNVWEKDFKDIPLPKSFEDLKNPKFKGKIVLPNPLTSGTGYSFINYLNEYLGDEKYKDIIKKIKDNTGLLSTRGYNVVQNVASGEYPIGISYLSNIKLMEKTVSNLIVITPKNVGVDLHGIGIINKKDNLDAEEAFVDFIISKETQEKLKDISFAYPVLDYKNLNNYSIIKNQNNEDIAIDTWKKS